MSDRDDYRPGAAAGAKVEQDGETWTLVLVRQLRHSPDKVWAALTDPAELREWAPFDADRSLGHTGAVVNLTTVGAPNAPASSTTVTRCDPPRLLEYQWGDAALRWRLEPIDGGTRLSLWHGIDKRFIAMGAAGWHIALDVLDRLLGGAPIGRIVGMEAMKFDWGRLNEEYARQFGVKPMQPPALT